MSMLNSSIKRKFSSLEFGIREKTILSLIIFAVFFITILVAGSMIDPEKFSIDLINKKIDEYNGLIVFDDKTTVKIEKVIDILEV